ncbi:hypothetical protein CYMTET_28519 [Cymbomonas tetramitiformis]|uniref:Uncharacterized protein n=1 Tax=Cymbomonas tetramitiformis TaxID=36881 RepID=A0AAE0FNB7_9CHLO|nr:hypothetical protein CYMTET_28519 [Cymbomonas tetramitiformis]
MLPEGEDNPPPRKTNTKSGLSHLLGHDLAANSGDSRILSDEDVPLLTEAAHILVQAVTEERSNAKAESLRVVKASSRLVRLYELQVQVGWENSEYGSRLLHSIQGSVVDVGDSVLHFLEGTVSNTSGVDANETFSFSEAGSVNKQDAVRPAFQGFSRDEERALLQQASPPSPGSNSTVPAKGITNDLTSRQQGPPPSVGPPAQGGSEGDLLTRYTAAPSAAAQSWQAPPELDQQQRPPPPEPYQLPSSCGTEETYDCPARYGGGQTECCDEDGDCADGDDAYCCNGELFCSNNVFPDLEDLMDSFAIPCPGDWGAFPGLGSTYGGWSGF